MSIEALLLWVSFIVDVLFDQVLVIIRDLLLSHFLSLLAHSTQAFVLSGKAVKMEYSARLSNLTGPIVLL